MSPEHTVINRNIVILPNEETGNILRSCSQELSAHYGSDITLRERQLPHISLYNSSFPIDAIDDVRRKLGELVVDIHPFKIQTTHAQMYEAYAFLNVELSAALQSLHERCIDDLNPLRHGAIPSTTTSLSREEVERLRRFGMLLSGPAFLPHFTVSHNTQNQTHANIMKEINTLPTLSFQVDSIHLVETGPYGTCKNIIESYLFGEQK